MFRAVGNFLFLAMVGLILEEWMKAMAPLFDWREQNHRR